MSDYRLPDSRLETLSGTGVAALCHLHGWAEVLNLVKEVKESRARIKELEGTLELAIDDYEGPCSYKSECFVGKHKDAEWVEKYRAVLRGGCS